MLKLFAAASACAVLAHVALGAPTPVRGCSAQFFAGTKLLGPAVLPATGVVGDELAGYKRTGSFTARAFLRRYRDANGWIYPPHDGYVDGEEAQLDLHAGQEVDRYGSEYGAYLAPAGLPYSARSIPPQNLDGEPAAGCNYHRYRVERAFAVEAGPIAPWFAQPGGGSSSRSSRRSSRTRLRGRTSCGSSRRAFSRPSTEQETGHYVALNFGGRGRCL